MAGTPIGIVVRRGALRRFDALKRKTAGLPVALSWDRREGDRRRASSRTRSERRGADRRQAPPFTWALADFVLVCEPEAGEQGSAGHETIGTADDHLPDR